MAVFCHQQTPQGVQTELMLTIKVPMYDSICVITGQMNWSL